MAATTQGDGQAADADREYRKGNMMSKPKEYDLTKPDEVLRWFRETRGYINTNADGKPFVWQGIDSEGRKFAMDAFDGIRNLALLGVDAIDMGNDSDE